MKIRIVAKPNPSAKYVYFQFADGYYESYDLASFVYPQTLLTDRMKSLTNDLTQCSDASRHPQPERSDLNSGVM